MVDVKYHEPFDLGHMLRWFARRGAVGLELVEGATYKRVTLVDEEPVVVGLTGRPERQVVEVHAEPDTPANIERGEEFARRMLDLDADSRSIDAHLGGVPGLEEVVARHPGQRIPGERSPEECVIRALAAVQVHVASTRTISSRMTVLGERFDSGTPALYRRPPTLDDVMHKIDEWYHGPESKRDTIVRVAGAMRDGDLVLTHDMEPDEVVERLMSYKGVSPCVATYVALRLTQRPDIAVVDDVGLLRGARALGVADTQRELSAWLERCSPYRSYACVRLWEAS